MKCCIATLYLPLFYKLGSITSKFMVSIFDIGYFNPLREGFLSAPALRVEAQCSRAPSNPINLVALFIVFFGFIVLLKTIGIELSTRYRFINPMNPRNTTNSMNPIPSNPGTLGCQEAWKL